MDPRFWWIWAILAALFIVGEIVTTGFFLLWFGIGAAAAALVGLLGLGAAPQWAVFVILSAVLVLMSRRFAERVTTAPPPGIGAERAIGKTGVVIEEIDPLEDTGRVRIEKDEWRAAIDAGGNIPVGAKVTVLRIEGTHLVVTPTEEV
jgi:membrane protein implicated in regulation of membrane protease activity